MNYAKRISCVICSSIVESLVCGCEKEDVPTDDDTVEVCEGGLSIELDVFSGGTNQPLRMFEGGSSTLSKYA